MQVARLKKELVGQRATLQYMDASNKTLSSDLAVTQRQDSACLFRLELPPASARTHQHTSACNSLYCRWCMSIQTVGAEAYTCSKFYRRISISLAGVCIDDEYYCKHEVL